MIRKHTKRRGRTALLVALGIVVSLSILHVRGLLTGVEGALQELLTPAITGLHDIGSGTVEKIQRVGSLWDADARLLEQESRIAELEAERERYRDIERENAALRDQLVVRDSPPRAALLARIIGTNTLASNTYLLDRGSADGLRLHLPVLANGSLVGYITGVEDRVSQLRFITDPKSVVKASIPDAKTRGVLVGTLGQRDLLLQDVPRDVTLLPGMSVRSEGVGDFQHSPIVVGVISEVLVGSSATSASARVTPTTRPRDLTSVLILLAP